MPPPKPVPEPVTAAVTAAVAAEATKEKPTTEPVAATAIPVEQIVALAADSVMTKLTPVLQELTFGLTNRIHQLVEEKMKPLAIDERDQLVHEIERDERGGERVHDADIPFLAQALTDPQLDRLLAMRRGSSNAARWAALGAVPGKHLVATGGVKLTYDGKAHLAQKDEVLEIAKLDPEEIEGPKGLRKRGHLVGPADAIAPH